MMLVIASISSLLVVYCSIRIIKLLKDNYTDHKSKLSNFDLLLAIISCISVAIMFGLTMTPGVNKVSQILMQILVIVTCFKNMVKKQNVYNTKKDDIEYMLYPFILFIITTLSCVGL